jgi:hypothetical protein
MEVPVDSVLKESIFFFCDIAPLSPLSPPPSREKRLPRKNDAEKKICFDKNSFVEFFFSILLYIPTLPLPGLTPMEGKKDMIRSI